MKRSGPVSIRPGTIFDLASKEKRIEELEKKTQEPDFWNDAEGAQTTMKRLNQVRMQTEPWLEAAKEAGDLIELAELLEGQDDSDEAKEVAQNAQALAKSVDALEFRSMLSEETDPNNCYLHVHAGAGGTEACDWAAMLVRMYERWAEQRGFEIKELDMQPGDEAGVKSRTFLIKGDYAFGYLKAESGVHRLVRISPFDASGRRHTSFASVYATPEIDDSIEVEIRDEDIRVDTYRSSGAGGQHVNKTDSAVRITHEPTGIVVSCQNERSQHKNRATAMLVLKARIYQHELEKRRQEQAVQEDAKMDIGWGSQIRSYVFQPYQMVKDLRTGWETGNIQSIMDGNLDGMIEEYLRQSAGVGSRASS